jgi:hypothetical protein
MSRATSQIDRRALIRSGTVAAFAAGTAVNLAAAKAAPIAGRADPICAAIINHRSAWEPHQAVLEAYGRGDESPAMQRRVAAGHVCADAAMTALAGCGPTTLQGAAELVNYLLEIIQKEDIEVLPKSTRTQS